MGKQQVWINEFDAAKAQGFSPMQAGAIADAKAREFESEQKFAATESAQREAVAYHALSVRDNTIDRKWAARLSAT